MTASRILLFSTLFAMLMLFSWGVTAQEPGSENELVLEEVIVTATRREMTVQEIPMSIAAITGEVMDKAGFDDFMDFAKSVPSLDFAQLGAGLNRATIRGISSNLGEAMVGYYIDDAPITADQWSQPDTKMFDVNRVEVLRGPQGTLYGEGSIGGTIRIINNQPQFNEFDAALQGETYSTAHSGDMSFGGDVMLNIPVVNDTFALRLVGSYRDQAGYIDNTFLNEKDVNTEETKALRLMALWEPTDKFTLKAAIHYNSIDSGAFFTSDENLDQWRTIAEPRFDEFYLYNLTMDYEFSFAQFTSATSYFERETGRPIDGNSELGLVNFLFGFFGVIYGPEFALGPYENVYTDYTLDYEIFTQEFRLVSTHDGPLQWTAGAFYKDSKRPGLTRGDTVPTSLPFSAPYPPGTEALIDRFDNPDEQKAIFGELTYQFNDRWTGIFGLRYFEEDFSDISEQYGLFYSPFDPAGWTEDPNPTNTTSSASVWTPKLALSWAATDDLMLYSIYSEGFRKGGANFGSAVDFGAPETYDPEEVKSYELGIKSTWLENRMVVNAAVFYNDWSDKQSYNTIQNPYLPVVETFVDNIGDAHTTGIELEITALPAEGLEISFGGNWIEAETDSEATAFSEQLRKEGALDTLITVPAGAILPLTPEYSFHVTADYQWTLSNTLTGMVRGQVSSIGESYNTLANEEVGRADSYTTADLSFAVAGDRWEVRLFCANCTDELATPSFDVSAEPQDIGVLFHPIRPRTIGLRASWRM